MIYTLTLNPSVDLIVTVQDNLKLGMINRAVGESIVAGGKGINVSRVLNTLKRDSIAVSFIGGVTGSFIEQELKRQGIKTDFVHANVITRVNTKLASNNGVTEVNAPAPPISKEDIVNIAKKFAKVKKEDVVIISGTLPKSLPLNVFDNLLSVLYKKGAYMVVDMSGSPLLRSLKYKPFLIKPNRNELAETLFISTKTDEDVVKGAKRLLKMGAQNVIVSLGKDGAIFVNEKEIHKLLAPEGEVKNTAGAGDSMLAGFVNEFLKSFDFAKAFKAGVIIGSATAFSLDLADMAMIKEVEKKIK